MKKNIINIIIYVVLLIIIIIYIFPILWTFLVSIKTPADAFSLPPKFIFKPTFQYYYDLWIKLDFFNYLKNSLIISFFTVIISIGISGIASFALTFYKKRISGTILIIVLFLRMFPRFALLIPFFVMSVRFGLFDTRTIIVLIMVALNQPFAIWMMRGFFLDVPMDLIDAARIDGCNMFGTYARVVTPVILPGLIATGIFTFLFAYNEFLIPLVLTSVNTKTLPVAIAEYSAEDLGYWSLAAAGAISIAAPAIIIIAFFQKYLVKGLMSGSLKE